MPPNDRLDVVVSGIVDSLKRSVRELGVTEDELWQAIEFLTEAGQRGEMALLSDVLGISVVVDQITHGEQHGATSSNVLGPFYLPGAPLLDPPYALTDPDEPGEPLLVSGRVTDALTSTPLPGAMLDVWQANASGLYSNQDSGLDEFHLRGKIPVDPKGAYEFRTVVPPPYEIPKDGPVGRLLRSLGRHAYRPAHLHFKVSREGYAPLTTMVFFRGGAYLDSDTVGAVKDSLVVPLGPAEAEGEPTPAGGSVTTCRFDVALRPA